MPYGGLAAAHTAVKAEENVTASGSQRLDRVQCRLPLIDRIATVLPYPFNLPESAYWGAVKLQRYTPRHAQFYIYIYTTSSIRSGVGLAPSFHSHVSLEVGKDKYWRCPRFQNVGS